MYGQNKKSKNFSKTVFNRKTSDPKVNDLLKPKILWIKSFFEKWFDFSEKRLEIKNKYQIQAKIIWISKNKIGIELYGNKMLLKVNNK